MLDRVARVDGGSRATATSPAEQALADAARADGEIAAGKRRGPLHGVPVAVKDLCDTAGVPRLPAWRSIATVCRQGRHRGGAAARRRGGDPGQAADDRGRVRRAPSGIPAPLNPWNEAYWTGSSSSGSGAATAAGFALPRSGPIPAARSAFPRPCAASQGSNPVGGASAAPVSSARPVARPYRADDAQRARCSHGAGRHRRPRSRRSDDARRRRCPTTRPRSVAA